MAALTAQTTPNQDVTSRRRSSNVSDVVDFIGKQASKTGKGSRICGLNDNTPAHLTGLG